MDFMFLGSSKNSSRVEPESGPKHFYSQEHKRYFSINTDDESVVKVQFLHRRRKDRAIVNNDVMCTDNVKSLIYYLDTITDSPN